MFSSDVFDAAQLVGKTIRCLYPRHNYHGLPATMEARVFRVREARDMQARPAEAVTILLNPLLRRGRWLLMVDDLNKHEERHVYWESMREVEVVEEVSTEEACIVVTVDPAGIESLVSPVLPIDRARSLTEAWNERTHRHGKTAEAREVRLPAFTRNAHGKIK